MANATLIRITLLIAVIMAFGFAATGYAPAADDSRIQVIQLVGSDANSRFVPLGVGKSVVIDLPRDIKDVLVADPTIANAVIRSARRAYIIGVKNGQTNVFFFDGNGDGYGDFRGLIEKLDYLQWLGVDCIWLLPMYPSPLKDGGYDVADFTGIHADFGTTEDFHAFVDEATSAVCG